MPSGSCFRALGTSVTILVAGDDRSSSPPADDVAVRAATRAVAAQTDAFDAACSRFRDDSELVRLGRSGRPVAVSALLYEAVDVAMRAAEVTEGLVDPTVGGALRELGYDRDFQFVSRDDPHVIVAVSPAPGWRSVVLDPDRRSITVPRGVQLDLGATAKALCVDRAADAAAAVAGRGVLVSIGGDMAVAGPPPDDGWTVQLSDDHADTIDERRPAVTLRSGGLATSGTAARRWTRGGRQLHHLVDPATGQPAVEVWRTCTVAAASCVDANIGSTAAMILGTAAPSWLEDHGLPARLVGGNGTTITVGDWPHDRPAPLTEAVRP
jgi:thiamine biosynthesis lipoprotein